MRRLAVAAAVLFALALPRTALPCGPGVHVREAGRGFDLLAAADAAWAEAGQAPRARAYLALGSIAPDFQWMSSRLGFGHEFGLAYHLLDAAEARGPEYRMFALGFTAHVTASDSACEQFYAPTFAAAAAQGVVDLNGAEDNAKGESESLVESLGDFILGDWDGVVETLYAFWLEGDEAKARGGEIFGWYCTEAAAYLGRSTDCAAAWGDIGGLLAQADGLLGGQSVDEAKDFVHSLIGQPLPDLMELFLGGFAQSLLGGQFQKSANFAREKERFFRSPLAEDAFWDRYRQGLGDLGPSWLPDRVALRLQGFPSWIDKPLFAGNVEASMATLPGEFAVVPGLVVDGLEWRRDGGAATSQVALADQGASFTLWVRLFSAYPEVRDLRVVVKKDLPGNDTFQDPVVAEQSFPLDIDPAAYARAPRTEVEVPVTLDLAGGLGLYAEFYLDDGLLPWFTTSWDRIWLTGAFDYDQASTFANFGTYGHWPVSLRVADPDVTDPWLFVKVRLAPAGGGVEEALVSVDAGGDAMPRTYVTGWNGIGVFPRAGDAPVLVTAEAVGYAPSDTVEATPAGHQETWATVWLHAIPRVSTPGPWQSDRRCLAFTVTAEPFQGQADRFLVTGRTQADPPIETAPAEAVPGAAATACFAADQADGTFATVTAQARYLDGSLGVEGTGPGIGIDGSAPVVGGPGLDAGDEPPCGADAVGKRPYTVTFPVEEPHSPVTGYAWKVGGGDWQALADVQTFPGELPGTWLAKFGPVDDGAPGLLLSVRVDNAAGLSGEASVTLPDWVEVPACPPEPTPDTGADVPAPDAGTDEGPARDDGPDAAGGDTAGADLPPADVPSTDTGTGKRGGGCAAGGPGAPAGVLPLLLAALAGFAQRRRVPH